MNCPECSKTYKNLKQHITKMHTKLHFVLNIDENNDDNTYCEMFNCSKLIEKTQWDSIFGDEIIFNFWDFGDDEYSLIMDKKTKTCRLIISKETLNGLSANDKVYKYNWTYTINAL